MSLVYISSDWHLGHKNISQYRKHVVTDEDNYAFIGDNYHLRKKDTLYLLGDIVFEPKALEFIQKLPAAKKILIAGNHDWERVKINMFDVCKTFDDIRGVKAYKNMWLTHMPIHCSEMQRKRVNVHGHLHDPNKNLELIDHPRYINVNVDVLWPKYGKICINVQDMTNEHKNKYPELYVVEEKDNVEEEDM